MAAKRLSGSPTGSQDRLWILVQALLLGIFVVIVLGRGAILWQRYSDTLDEGRSRAQTLANILSEQLARTIEGYDGALAQLASHSQRVGGPTASPDAWNDVLQAARSGLVGVGSFSVLDAAGVIRHSTLPQLVGQSRADRFLYRELTGDGRNPLLADTPFFSPNLQRYIAPLGRRLSTPSGEFAGAIVVTFEPERLRAFYRSVDLGHEGIVWVLHPAALVVLREPSAFNPMGEPAIGNPVLRAHRQQPAAGYVRAPMDASGTVYLTAYRQLEQPPLIVAVSLSERDVLAKWWDDLFPSVGRLAVLGLLLGFGAHRLGREIGARRNAEAELTDKVAALQRTASERDEAHAALSASEVRFQAVMEHAPTPVILKDRDGRYLFINRAAERWSGFAAADVLGKTARDILPPDQACEQERSDQEVVSKAAPIQREISRSMPAGQRTMLSVKFPIFDAAGAVSTIGVVLVDLTAQKQVEAQLIQSQKMEAVGQLTGGIAHDFNNLLTAILINTDTLVHRLDGDPELRSLAQVTLEAAERGAELTRRLLAFSRRQVLEARPVDVNQLVHGMERLLHRTLGEHIAITLALSDQLRPARVDPHQLATAILNLAVNARDAMPDGGRLTIETADVTLDQAYADSNLEVAVGDYVLLAVSDTGKGMSAEVLGHAFEPFFTTKDVGEGTGLGLSMVYGFVKQSDGHVQIYSEPGVGTAVKLYLPRAEAVPAPARQSPPASQALPRGNELILLVEDDRLVRDNAEMQLQALGYAVVTAENAADALAKVEAGLTPDLLFTDVVMPGRASGFDLAQQLRARWPQLRVLFTSGYTHGATLHRDGATLSTEHFLSKPFRRRDLATKVREALGSPPV